MAADKVLIETAKFINKIQQITNAHHEGKGTIPPQITADIGEAFIRVVRHNIVNNTIWVLCFIMRDTGNIRLPLGLRAFDRYNIGTVVDKNVSALIGSDGTVRPIKDTPSDYDPEYKKKRKAPPRPTHITSHEEERQLQIKYAKDMLDNEE